MRHGGDAKSQKSRYHNRSRSSSCSRVSPKSDDHENSSEDSDFNVPKVPFNPLRLAYSSRSFKSNKRDIPPDYNSSERWDHDLYDSDSERAAAAARIQRERIHKKTDTIIDTRKGAWRSRAGGVYLPPKEEVSDQEDLYYMTVRGKFDRKRKDRSRSPPVYERPDPVYTLD